MAVRGGDDPFWEIEFKDISAVPQVPEGHLKVARRFIAGIPKIEMPVPAGRMSSSWKPVKRPSGTLPVPPINPAINRRATLGHSSGMTEFLKETFAKVSTYLSGPPIFVFFAFFCS